MNLKTKFNSNKDDERFEIAKLFLIVACAATNTAFFNWTESKIKEELEISKTVTLFDDQMHEYLAFISFRESAELIDIMALGVHPQHTRMGHMKRLISELQAHSREASKEVLLEVHEHNLSAIELYNRMGFQKISFRPSYYQDGCGAFIYKWANELQS